MKLRAGALLVLSCCVSEPPGPASPGSPSALGAVGAGELAAAAGRARDRALALEAACDAERLAHGEGGVDPVAIRVELTALQAEVDEARRQLNALEALARAPAGP